MFVWSTFVVVATFTCTLCAAGNCNMRTSIEGIRVLYRLLLGCRNCINAFIISLNRLGKQAYNRNLSTCLAGAGGAGIGQVVRCWTMKAEMCDFCSLTRFLLCFLELRNRILRLSVRPITLHLVSRYWCSVHSCLTLSLWVFISSERNNHGGKIMFTTLCSLNQGLAENQRDTLLGA